MSDFILPDKKAVEKTVKSLYKQLFPKTHSYTTDGDNDNLPEDTKEQLLGILSNLTANKVEVSSRFFANLEEIKETLLKDASFIL